MNKQLIIIIAVLISCGCASSPKSDIPEPSLQNGEVVFPVFDMKQAPLSMVLNYLQEKSDNIPGNDNPVYIAVQLASEPVGKITPVSKVTDDIAQYTKKDFVTFRLTNVTIRSVLIELKERTGMTYKREDNMFIVKHPKLIIKSK